MTWTRLALGVAVVVAAGSGAALAVSADPPYTKRLQILESLAVRYPGRVETHALLGKYGLWAGIVVQTTWQKDSGRDRIPLWSLINRHLSVEPSIYAAVLEKAGSRADPRALCASRPPSDVCGAWMRTSSLAKQSLLPADYL